MNHCVPSWNMEGDLLSVGHQKKSMGADHELVELLWRNGQVVLQSQTNRKPGLNVANESRPVQKTDQSMFKGIGSFGNSSNLIQEDETASWIQYPVEDSLEKEFSDFFYEFPTTNPPDVCRPVKQFEADKYVKLGVIEENNALGSSSTLRSPVPTFKHSNGPSLSENPMPPPRLQVPPSTQQDPNLGEIGRAVNFSYFSKPIKAGLGSSKGLIVEQAAGNLIRGEVGDSSAMTIGSSHCSSNQIANEADLSHISSNGVGVTPILPGPVKEGARKVSPQCEIAQTVGDLEPTVTSSSCGSGSSFGRAGKQQSSSTPSNKRKGREADESEHQSEEAEFESAEANKPVQRSGSSRRSRAAEVHNLSERRRRDRINEKMRALQELIPHCNKSDKASMLDEAIEYLKSLQLQVQIMCMGSGMAPMMFPGVQHYMSRMGMGIGPPSLPSMHNTVQLPRVPIVDQAIATSPAPNQPVMCPPPVLTPINFQNQMQNSNFPEQYAHYMGLHMASQPMNMFGYGSQVVPQGHKMVPPVTSGGPCNGGVPIDNSQSCKLG